MPSVRASTRRMRWNKLLMKALHAHTAPHMFQNLWVSVRTRQKHQVFKFENINLSDLVFIYFRLFFFSLHNFCIVVESAIMASIKIKEPGE